VRKFWRIFGWIFLGIFLQFKFNALYGIVFLENLNFHDRAYWVEMDMTATDESLSVLNVKTTVHHSLGSDYFANIYIPDKYKVLNAKPYAGAETLPGYQTYKMSMKRKYRDVLAKNAFILAPQKVDEDSPQKPIIIHFENLKQRLHTDKTFQVTFKKGKTLIEGPQIAEATYPQKLGM